MVARWGEAGFTVRQAACEVKYGAFLLSHKLLFLLERKWVDPFFYFAMLFGSWSFSAVCFHKVTSAGKRASLHGPSETLSYSNYTWLRAFSVCWELLRAEVQVTLNMSLACDFISFHRFTVMKPGQTPPPSPNRSAPCRGCGLVQECY